MLKYLPMLYHSLRLASKWKYLVKREKLSAASVDHMREAKKSKIASSSGEC